MSGLDDIDGGKDGKETPGNSKDPNAAGARESLQKDAMKIKQKEGQDAGLPEGVRRGPTGVVYLDHYWAIRHPGQLPKGFEISSPRLYYNGQPLLAVKDPPLIVHKTNTEGVGYFTGRGGNRYVIEPEWAKTHPNQVPPGWHYLRGARGIPDGVYIVSDEPVAGKAAGTQGEVRQAGGGTSDSKTQQRKGDSEDTKETSRAGGDYDWATEKANAAGVQELLTDKTFVKELSDRVAQKVQRTKPVSEVSVDVAIAMKDTLSEMLRARELHMPPVLQEVSISLVGYKQFSPFGGLTSSPGYLPYLPEVESRFRSGGRSEGVHLVHRTNDGFKLVNSPSRSSGAPTIAIPYGSQKSEAAFLRALDNVACELSRFAGVDARAGDTDLDTVRKQAEITRDRAEQVKEEIAAERQKERGLIEVEVEKPGPFDRKAVDRCFDKAIAEAVDNYLANADRKSIPNKGITRDKNSYAIEQGSSRSIIGNVDALLREAVWRNRAELGMSRSGRVLGDLQYLLQTGIMPEKLEQLYGDTKAEGEPKEGIRPTRERLEGLSDHIRDLAMKKHLADRVASSVSPISPQTVARVVGQERDRLKRQERKEARETSAEKALHDQQPDMFAAQESMERESMELELNVGEAEKRPASSRYCSG